MNAQKNSLSETKRKLLEKCIFGLPSGLQGTAPTITRRTPGEQAPLALVQEQIYRRSIANRESSSFYNESITIQRNGNLNKEALQSSVTQIVRRHESWRTTFDTVEGKLIQIVHAPPASVPLPFLDLRELPEDARKQAALILSAEHARQPFDLRKGPLVRALLVTLDDDRHLLFLTMHQSVTDGMSVYQVFPKELTALYESFSKDLPSTLPTLSIQYADFALWDRQPARQQLLNKQLAYWRNQLAGLSLLEWPNQPVQKPATDSSGSIHPFIVGKPLRDRLIDLSRRKGITLFTTLLAAFTILLFRYTGQEEIVTGTIAPGGRKHAEVQSLLGYFLNPVTLRLNLSGNPSIRDLLRQCQETVLGALANDDIPLEHLMEVLGVSSHPACDSPFNVAITLAPPTADLDSSWIQTPMDSDTGWTRWDLYVELSDRPTGIIGRAQYRAQSFTSAMITQFVQQFTSLLESLTANSENRLLDLLRSCE